MESFPLFSLIPLDDISRAVVRNYNETNMVPLESSVISFMSQRTSIVMGRLVSLGSAEPINDVVVQSSGIEPAQCRFTLTPGGDVMLHDKSAWHTTLLTVRDNQSGTPLEQYEFVDGSPRRRVLPMSDHVTIRIRMGTAECTFEVRWDFDVGEDWLPRVRAELARLYHMQHRPFEQKPLGDELTDATVLHKRRALGRGTYGVTNEAVDVVSGRVYAVKDVSLPCSPTLDIRVSKTRLVRELDKASNITHRHILPVLLSRKWETARPLEIISEMYSGSSRDFFKPDHSCTRRLQTVVHHSMATFLQQTLSALAYLHGKGMLHRNIKPENILFRCAPGTAGPPEFALADLGLAIARPVGDCSYLAPETARAGAFTAKSDVFAFGLTLLQLLGVVCLRELSAPAASAWREKLFANGLSRSIFYREDEDVAGGEPHRGFSRLQSLCDFQLIGPTEAMMVHRDAGNRLSANEARIRFAKELSQSS